MSPREKLHWDSQQTSKGKALLALMLQSAIVGGVAGCLVISPEPWARYGLAVLFLFLFLFLAGRMAWNFRQARNAGK